MGPTATLPSPRITVTDVDCVTVEWDVPEDEVSSEFVVSYKSEGSSIWSEVAQLSNIRVFSCAFVICKCPL